MGRTRSFDEEAVVAAAAGAFLATGFEGTSVDDLVAATGLFRGSLYQAFGSKRGLFVTALRAAAVRRELVEADLDLLLVALLDVAPTDPGVREVCASLLARLPGPTPQGVLGDRLVRRAGLADLLQTLPDGAPR